MNQYDQYEYEEEIDIKDLFFYMLRRWKLILLSAAVFALLLGGLKGYQGYKKLQDKEAIAKSQAEYDEAKAAYDYARDQYLKRVDRMKEEIAEQEAFQDTSIMMNIDPYMVYTAGASYYVSTDYQIMPGMEFQNLNYTTHVLNTYRQVILSSDLLKSNDVIANLDEAEARQMITVQVDPDNGLLNVIARGDNKELASMLLKSMESTVENSKDRISALVHKHEIQLIKEDHYITADETILKKQTELRDNLAKMEKAVSDALIERDKLKEPVSDVYTKNSLKLDVIKYLLFGAFVGTLLVCAFYGMIYFLNGTLKNSDYLARKYSALIIGEISFEKSESSRELALTAATVQNLLRERRSFLLTGNVPEMSLELLRTGLQPYLEGICVVSEAELMNNPKAMKVLGETDAVVFVEQTEVSKVKDIDAAFNICDAMNVNILGCIVLK